MKMKTQDMNAYIKVKERSGYLGGCQFLGFSSDHDLTGHGIKSQVRHHGQWGVCFRIISLLLPLPSTCTCSSSLSQKKTFKNKFKKDLKTVTKLNTSRN